MFGHENDSSISWSWKEIHLFILAAIGSVAKTLSSLETLDWKGSRARSQIKYLEVTLQSDI